MSASSQIPGSRFGTGNNSRPSSKDGPKKNIWSSMLDSVANGKRLPEKNLLILGGTPESQREFLDTLAADSSDPSLSNDKRKGRVPPVANQFALGYTYQDVLDADHEDTLARVSAYLLSEPSLSFAPLLKPLLTPQSIPETLVVILLDWSDPWTWIRRLREWVRLLRHVLISLDDETKIVMEENLTEWRDRKRGTDPSSGGAQGFTSSGGPVTIPLGPGEWDEGLGIPMCVVCQGADKIEKLEKDHGWHEEQFDFILQFMRTLLLKHGASLIYTTPFLANSLQSLIQSSLGIHSLLKRQSLKHNVIDRDKILVPSNWDSWGKIRIIREGFDMEGISTAWSIEIQDPPEPLTNGVDDRNSDEQTANAVDDGTSAVAIFEQTIQDPKRDTSMALTGSQRNGNKIEVDTSDMQSFLTKQLEVLEQLKAEDEKDRSVKKVPQLEMSPLDDNGRVNEHIGPVQFNMGGIQVDADDMLRKLKEREASRSQRKETLSSSAGDEKAHNQALANFFAGLVKKPGASPRGSPSA
ncbi:dynein light intermediate chain [Aspergillus eucalypticola CBS 122712]|uniref:Dynein light intermediate chain n=1 Tax=Aspergillus eucalypticola (strain CBS 122712 / IBT 29274) TaxID=1448314 RepID=A0A317W3N5_ASPEC|nr:dynein light intermediate chain [Aspergillus eucalypticola CBS 122712]PWY80191.1 dynein light intermediate chain [Aspergillus eucalypticola CBS 122712]